MNRPTVPSPASRADRIAARIVPPLRSLGEPWTIATPIVLVALVSLLALAGIDPMLERALLDDPARLAAVRWGVRIVSLLAPVAAAAKGLLLGGAAWAVLVLVGATPRFRAIVSAVLYGEVVLALQGLWISFVIHLRAGRGVLGPADLHVPMGFDLLVTPASPAVAALVQGFSVFHVAWVLLLLGAFAEGASTSRARASTAAFAVWALTVGMTVLRSATA